MEIWKDIDGYNGDYQISNFGRVKSLKHKTPKIMRLKTNNKGYKWVALISNGKQGNFLVHRLVASHFLPNENNFPIINHIDENPANNNVDNLEWCTYSYNTKKSTKFYDHYRELKKSPRTKNSKHKDTARGVCQLSNGQVIKKFKNSLEVKNICGFDQSFILSVCRNKRKSAYGYQWQFI